MTVSIEANQGINATSILKNIFTISPVWLCPLKIHCSSEDHITEKDFKDFIDSVFNHSHSLQEKSAKELLPFLRLEMEGINSLMHYLVIFKHTSSFDDYFQIGSSIRRIEEKCRCAFTPDELERYLNVKNSEGLTYKELDLRLQNYRIKDVFFRTLTEQLGQITTLHENSPDIFCDPVKLVELCMQETLDSKTLHYRANRDLKFENEESLLVYKGDTIFNIAARLFLRGQARSFFLCNLYILAYRKRNQGGNKFLEASTVDKITNSVEGRQKMEKIHQHSLSAFVGWLMDSLCTKSLEASEDLKNALINNLKCLLNIKKNNENFFHQFVRQCWLPTVKSEALKNYFLLLNMLDSCIKTNLLRNDASLAFTLTNQQGQSVLDLHDSLATHCSLYDVGHFLEKFFACPEAFQNSLLFAFRIKDSRRVNYLSEEVPLCEGDTLLHIAIRLYHANLITIQIIERIMDRVIFSADGGTFLRFRNREQKQYKGLLSLDEKDPFANLLVDSLVKLFKRLFFEDFSKFNLYILESIKLVNSGLISLEKVGNYFFYLVDQIYGPAGSPLAKSNLSQLIQLLKKERRFAYEGACQKLLEYKNSKNISFLEYAETRQRLYSQTSNQPQKSSAKIPLSAWESMLITSLTEEAREQLTYSEEREIIIANLMKKALETRKQKISHEPNSLVKAKFIKKLNNSIKKLL